MTKTVLVTGASGFVAAHVLHDFLGAGYNVRAAVRSESTANKVRKTHGKYGDALSFAIIPDIAATGAFDEAVKGVDGVGSLLLESTWYDKANRHKGYPHCLPFRSQCRGLRQRPL